MTTSTSSASGDEIEHDVPFALEGLGGSHSQASRRWLQFGAGLAAVGYAAFTGLAQFFGGLPTSDVVTQTLTALVCLVAFLLAGQGRIRLAARLAIGAIWFEIHFEVYEVGLNSPGLLILAPLVASAGMLVGGRAGYALAGLTSLAVPTAAFLGHWQRGTTSPDLGLDIYLSLLVAVLSLGIAILVDFAMKAMSSVATAAIASERRVSALIRHSPDGMLAIASDGTVESVNPAAERMLAGSADEIVGRPWESVFAPRLVSGGTSPADPLAGLLDAEAEGSLLELDSTGGVVAVEARTTRFRRRSGKEVTQLTLRDVTERVNAERLEREVQTRLEESNRLDAVGRLAGGIAHEFNNNLTVIGGFAELLITDENSEDVQELASGILDMQQRASHVTKRLLAFARKDVLRPSRVRLGDVVDETRPLLRSVVGQGINLETRVEAGPEVLADPQQIEHLLVNLLANAKDAQGGAGSITVSVQGPGTESLGRAGEPIRVPDGFVELRVDDPGPGMEAESVARAFEPFYTEGPFGERAGMGLATVHGIVVQNGGMVSLDSALGVGTTVRIHWPVAVHV